MFSEPIMRLGAVTNRQLNSQLRQLAKREGFAEAHRKYGEDVFRAKVELVAQLRKTGLDPDTGEFRPELMTKDLRKDYITALQWFEKSGFGAAVVGDSADEISVTAVLVNLRKSLGVG